MTALPVCVIQHTYITKTSCNIQCPLFSTREDLVGVKMYFSSLQWYFQRVRRQCCLGGNAIRQPFINKQRNSTSHMKGLMYEKKSPGGNLMKYNQQECLRIHIFMHHQSVATAQRCFVQLKCAQSVIFSNTLALHMVIPFSPFSSFSVQCRAH